MVRNDRRTKLMPKILLGQLLFALMITVISLGVIFYAQGIRFDYKNLAIIRTGVLVVDFLPKDATVLINEEEMETGRGTLVENLVPNTYFLSVSKSGFNPYTRRLKIEPESVNVFKNIILFRSEVDISILDDEKSISNLNSPLNDLATRDQDDLSYNDYEIWIKDALVTRFSKKIDNAIWYSDYYHIIYQQGNEIRVIESDGYGDALLFRLEQETPTRMAVGKRGQEIYFIDNDVYKVAEIR